MTSTVIVVCSIAGRAHGQSADAEALFNDGNKLMAEGKLAQACSAFEASNHAEPSAGTLIRLGDCLEQSQRLASAWTTYRSALARVRDPHKREYAMAKVSALESRLSYLTVLIPPESQVGGLILTRNGKLFDSALWNRSLPVDGGEYVITGRAPGREEWEITASVPAERAKVTIKAPVTKDLSKPATQPAAPKPAMKLAPALESNDGAATRFTPVLPTNIAPAVLQSLRISGDVQVQPPPLMQRQMIRDGVRHLSSVVKLCLSASGAISSAAILVSSKYPAYDDAILAAMHDVRFRAFTRNGVSVPVCSSMALSYALE